MRHYAIRGFWFVLASCTLIIGVYFGAKYLGGPMPHSFLDALDASGCLVFSVYLFIKLSKKKTD